MSSGAPEESKSPRQSAINWSAIAPGIAFIVIIAIGLVIYANQQAQAQRQIQAERRQARELGLPDGYPLRDIPPYPGMKISESKREDATSSDDRPMDKWEVHGTSADDKKVIFDFYKEKLLGRGMGQTQYISIPTGFGVNYADEQYSVELEIEKQPRDEATRIVLRVYRIK